MQLTAELEADFDLDANESTLITKGKEWATEIGDSKQPDFIPQIKIAKWGNEFNFSVRKVAGAGTNYAQDNKAIYEEGDTISQIYLSPSPDTDSGEMLKFDTVFLSKPKTNMLRYTLTQKGIKYLYQPPLTQQQIDQGHIRPENASGSYAIYAGKANNQYGTGKLAHIYRPYAIDADGNLVWCDLKITGANLTVTIPQTFLNDARYPVTVDPDFGYTTIGAGSYGLENTRCFANAGSGRFHTASTGDTITSYSAYAFTYTSATLSLSGYSVSGGYASSRLASSATEAQCSTSSETPAWLTTNTISHALSNGVAYTVAMADAAATARVHYDTGVSGDADIDTVGGALPASWNHVADQDYIWSIYATYTAGGSSVNQLLVAQNNTGGF